MNIVLNSRVLVGPNHAAADRFTRQWRPSLAKDIEWIQSPSDLCVLSITRAQGETLPDDEAAAARASSASGPSRGKPRRSVYPATLAMTNGLEDELRRHLGLTLPVTSPH